MTKIKLVTFDLDDTLWAVSPVVIRANRLCWEWMQEHTPAFTERYVLEDLYEGSELRRQLLERYPEITHSMTLIRLRLLEFGYKEVGYSEEDSKHWANRAFELFHQHRHAVEPYKDVRDMLTALKEAGYLVGALSNGNAEIRLTPLAQWFDFQYNADGVGTAKPHPLMFEKALEHAGVTATEAVHIGDHPINDVKAAKELGFKTIWVNPEGLDYPHQIEADLIVEELSDLPRAIASL
ncbi:MAG TPA: HAD family hydrolase [Marinobacterium sp.]|nr:HAD family hydrolase [Marinobacterium sp.]